jgi:hypothetical protein
LFARASRAIKATVTQSDRFAGIRRAVRISHTPARHHADLPRIQNRALATLGLHHPDGSRDRAFVYILVELLPEMLSGPGAQHARRRVANKLDPEKLYRELSDRLAASDTIASRAALAAECLKIGRFEEAERHYDHILKLPMGSEPLYALGKAKAEFGRNRWAETIATLDELQERWPDFQSAEGHLLYARALAEVGRPMRHSRNFVPSQTTSLVPRRACVTDYCST